MKKYEEFSFEERKNISKLFANWLSVYTNDVIMRVMSRAEEIINNEFALQLLTELADRDEKERSDLQSSLDYLFRDYDGFKSYDVHNHCLTHSQSYRDILYDMYISR